MTKRIILTGGGSAGHVAVNLALIPGLTERGWDISYIGSETGIERELLKDYPQLDYYAIKTGKFRRGRQWSEVKQNLGDIGRVVQGTHQARRLVRQIQPDVIFSKGGYVSVPVVLAGHGQGVPVLSHESDLTPGLANRIAMPFSQRIFLTFEKTADYVKQDKAYYLGPIIRQQIKGGSRERGLSAYGFSGQKPVLLVLGGSLGAASLNQVVWDRLDSLLETFDILHGVGKGKGNPSIQREGYVQQEYIREEMRDVLAMADCIISRAGSNAIFEYLYYNKPMLLVPYELGSRGDQIVNARDFVEKGYAEMIREGQITGESFAQALQKTWEGREAMQEAQRAFVFQDGVSILLDQLEEAAKKGESFGGEK